MNPFVNPAERDTHSSALEALNQAGVPYLVGGAYAMFHHTGVVRYTKDLDLFLAPTAEGRARAVLESSGWSTHVHEPTWLSKAVRGQAHVDLIHGSGNGLSKVDDSWLAHGAHGRVLGVPTRLVAPEEMVWSKAFVQERDRWDGADISHLVRACGSQMDWPRLVGRFGQDHWHVLLAHLLLFRFTYPHDGDAIPRPVWRMLVNRARRLPANDPANEKLCRGPLLSRTQYLPDLGLWGYRDARELECPGFVPSMSDPLPRPFARHVDEPEPALAAVEV